MSTPSTTKQSISFLRRRFAEAGIGPDTRHGQNFLIDLNLQRVLVDEGELEPRDVVLEVGTGTGALTAEIAERAGAVVTVEIDPALYQLASEELHKFPNITMLHQDALRNKNCFAPELIAAVQEQMATVDDAQLKLVANLPYNIATPVISNLLSAEVLPTRMVGTIQKELADRIVADPSTKDYSALSIWIQSQCRPRIARVMPPDVFWPRPKVTSAIVTIDIDLERRARIPDRRFFHEFVRAIYLHRRKFLRSVVLSALKKYLTKPQLDRILADLEIDGTVRAEQLTVEQTLALSEAVRQEVGSVPILGR